MLSGFRGAERYAAGMIRFRIAGLATLALAATGCTSDAVSLTSTTGPSAITPSTAPVSSTSTTGNPGETTTTVVAPTTVPLSELRITLIETDSGFDRPVLLVADPDGGHDYIVEQPGRIVRADGGEHAVALDIRGAVKFGGEQGLLGLAFHPGFALNRLAYVNYIDNRGATVIEQFEVHDGIFAVATGSAILVIGQPAGNHNGGMIAFGPRGFLWIGMGDGGAANDAFGNGQNPHTLLGSMLRIAVPGSDGAPYDIPELNPYTDGADGAPEVYWTGLRNPWRFAFDFFEDGVGANVWVADVGQDEIEEVSLVLSDSRRANLGWPVMEGSECFQSESCDRNSFILPVTEYTHDDGCSITGGYVYRGDSIPELDGHYFYSDFCSGFLRSYSLESGNHDWTGMTGITPQMSGFGIGRGGELYVVSLTGSIYRIERAG